jgi:long-chain fatty acid transport protein
VFQIRTAVRIAPAIAVLVATARADASPLFEVVGDPGPGGLTARVNADGAAAAYFNPALLADLPPGLDLGIVVVGEEIGITVDGRGTSPACKNNTCDVPAVDGRGPESFRDGANGPPIADPTIPTDWLQHGRDTFTPRPRQAAGSSHQARAYQTVGLIAPVFHSRLVLGLFAMIPLGQFTTAKAFYNDEREQYFSNSLHPELYGDRMTATSLAFGGGFHLTPSLRLGVTFTLSLANHAAAPVYVSNLSDLSTVNLDSDIGVEASVAPHFGLAWTPSKRARLAATVHTPSAFKIDTGFDYTLATGVEQSTELHFTHSYLPLQVAAGGTYRLAEPDEAGFSVTGQVLFARWSHYRDRHNDEPSGDYAWSDTINATVGARWDDGPTRAWLDATYVPSPVPDQTGRTNYVDNDRIGGAAGVEHVLSGWGSRFRIGVDLFAHRLLARHVTKFIAPAGTSDPALVRDEIPDDAVDVLGQPVPGREGLQTNNPGFPGFGSSGWIAGAGLHVAVEY